MAEPIRIIITQGGTGGAGLGLGGTEAGLPNRGMMFGKEGEEKLAGIGFSKKEILAFAGIGIAATKKNIMNSFYNYSNITGSYITQTKINEELGVITDLAGMITGTTLGFKVGGLAGAGIALAGMVINKGINITQQRALLNIEIAKTDYQADRMRQRAGMSIGNSSRGTEN